VGEIKKLGEPTIEEDAIIKGATEMANSLGELERKAGQADFLFKQAGNKLREQLGKVVATINKGLEKTELDMSALRTALISSFSKMDVNVTGAGLSSQKMTSARVSTSRSFLARKEQEATEEKKSNLFIELQKATEKAAADAAPVQVVLSMVGDNPVHSAKACIDAAIAAIAIEPLKLSGDLNPTLKSGNNATVIITGGIRPYLVTLRGQAAKSLQCDVDDSETSYARLTITAREDASPGSSIVEITDHTNSSTRDVIVTVERAAMNVKLETPSVGVKGGENVKLSITGGQPPYTAIDFDKYQFDPPLPIEKPGRMEVKVKETASPGDFKITIRDSEKAASTVTVTIIAAKLAVALQGNQSVKPGEKVHVYITGGRPPYNTIGLDAKQFKSPPQLERPGEMEVIVQDSARPGLSVDPNNKIVIQDKEGNTADVTVTIESALSVKPGDAVVVKQGDKVTLAVSGGSGEFNVSNQDDLKGVFPSIEIVKDKITATCKAEATPGNYEIIIQDKGKSYIYVLEVTVKSVLSVTWNNVLMQGAQGAVAVAQGGKLTLTVSGGNNQFYVSNQDDLKGVFPSIEIENGKITATCKAEATPGNYEIIIQDKQDKYIYVLKVTVKSALTVKSDNVDVRGTVEVMQGGTKCVEVEGGENYTVGNFNKRLCKVELEKGTTIRVECFEHATPGEYKLNIQDKEGRIYVLTVKIVAKN
jgi:hypothetical protein